MLELTEQLQPRRLTQQPEELAVFLQQLGAGHGAGGTHDDCGMTIDALELDLGSNIFTCGQSYTALSRAKKLSSIKIIDIDKDLPEIFMQQLKKVIDFDVHILRPTDEDNYRIMDVHSPFLNYLKEYNNHLFLNITIIV